MPRTIRTMGQEGADREIDALWHQLEQLKAMLKSLAPDVSKRSEDAPALAETYLEVTETDGAPFLNVTGLEFESGKFEVVQNGAYAQILNLAGGLPADSDPLPIASVGATGVDTQHYALDDHTHAGVHQITPFGTGTPYRGNVALRGVKGIEFAASTEILADIDYGIRFPLNTPYNVTRDDDVLIVDASNGNFVCNLYQSFGNDIGKAWHYIKKNDTTDNTVTLNAYPGDGIEGSSSIVLRHKGDATFIVCSAAGRWDAFPDVRTMVVRKNSTGTNYRRRRINFIEGANVNITVDDDPTNEEVDVTIASSAAPSSSQSYWRMLGQCRNRSPALLDSSFFEEDGANRWGQISAWRHFCTDGGGSLFLPCSYAYLLFWARMNIVNSSGADQTFNLTVLAHDDSLVILNHRNVNGIGVINVNMATKTITGVGTSFTSDFVVGDYIVIGSFILRITNIASNTVMTYANNPSETWSPSMNMNYQIAKKVYASVSAQPFHNTTYTVTMRGNSTHTIHVLGNNTPEEGYWLLLLDAFDNVNLSWQDAGA